MCDAGLEVLGFSFLPWIYDLALHVCRYLMDPKWEFVKFFGKNHTADSLADGIAGEIAAWGSQT